MFCDTISGVTARSRYQTNAVEVHDFVKTVHVWPQAYEKHCRIVTLGGVVLIDT